MKKQIIIIGRQNLQNSLLASFLNQNTEIDCLLLEAFDPSKVATSEAEETLLLIDTKDTAIRETKRAIFGQPLPKDTLHIAFINVSKGSSYEQMISYSGIRGLFYDQDSQEKLLKGTLAIFANDYWLPRRLLTQHLENTRTSNVAILPQNSPLTRREREILRLTATGATNVEIAKQLTVSTHTIKTHMYNIFKKIDVSNRLQAVNWAKLHIGENQPLDLSHQNTKSDKAIA